MHSPSRRIRPLWSNRNAGRQRGSALLLVIILLAVILLPVGLQALSAAKTEVRIAHNDYLSKQALASAEAGLAYAFELLKTGAIDGFDNELSGGGTGGSLAALGSLSTLDGTSYRFAAFGGGAADDGYYVRLVDNFDELPNNASADVDDTVKLIARGRFGGAERTVEALVSGGSGGFSLFGRQSVTLSGGSAVDSYDAALGPYDPVTNAGSDGHTGSNGDITLSGGTPPTQIRGDVSARVAGDITLSSDSVIDGDARAGGSVQAGGSATVTGSSVSNSGEPALNWPSVTPCGPSYSDATGISGGDYSGAADGELKASGGGNITLAGGSYCFRKVTLSGSSTLTITAPTVIFLTEKSDLSGGGVMNTTLLPANLQIFSSGSELVVSGGSQAAMSVYAPDAKVDLTGGSTFYGRIIGDQVTLSGGTRFHGDTSLGQALSLSAYHEVGN